MDCRTTFTTRRTGRRGAGLTLPEVCVTMAIASLLMLAVAGFSLYTGKSFAGLGNYVDLEIHSQQALDKMTKAIRQTQQLASISSNQMVFTDWDGAALSYTYSPGARTLTQSKNGVTDVLLRECDYLCFSNFQRNPITNSYDQYPVATSPTNTKVVSMTWVCSRTIIGTKLNTESVQTAKIVIRKQ
jgi:prepilin-type N-terminal cleavage/methylation domain-containing protein